MSGGGSKKGRKLSQYRRCNFYPRPAEEATIDALFMAWPVERLQSLIARTGVRSNVRARI